MANFPPEVRRKAMDDSSGLVGNNWLGGWHVAAGGEGLINAWVQVNSLQRVTDRMIIKDTWTRESSAEPVMYKGIYDVLRSKGLDFSPKVLGLFKKKVGKGDRFFKEAWLQGLLTNVDGRISYTTPLRGYKRGNNDRKGRKHWRTYINWYHHGSLDDIIRRRLTHGRPNEDGYYAGWSLPEPFIWHVFASLAKALINLEIAARSIPHARPQRDETIVMCDMKCGNVLLDAPVGPQPGRPFPAYPLPLMTDFGGAHLTYPSHNLNQQWGDQFDKNLSMNLDHLGTEGYQSPESWRWFRGNQAHHRAVETPISSQTNVWQAARIVEALMRLDPRPADTDYFNPNYDRDHEIEYNMRRWFNDGMVLYSHELRTLVSICQRRNPVDRLTPRELLEHINNFLPTHGAGMEDYATEGWIVGRARRWETATADEIRLRNQDIDRRRQEGEFAWLDSWKDQNLARMFRGADCSNIPGNAISNDPVPEDPLYMDKLMVDEDGHIRAPVFQNLG